MKEIILLVVSARDVLGGTSVFRPARGLAEPIETDASNQSSDKLDVRVCCDRIVMMAALVRMLRPGDGPTHGYVRCRLPYQKGVTG